MELSPQIKNALTQKAEALCNEQGATLLFLTLFGSSLYGTQTPGKSDLDIRGIFLPSIDALALNKASRSLHYSTNNDGQKNSAEDVDMDLWSVQHWLLKLLPAGDTGALDVLFAPSHEACTLFMNPLMDKVFAEPQRLIDTSNGSAYAEYSLGQARKYGIKGSRVGALKTVRNWLLEHVPDNKSEDRLRDYIDALAAECADGRYCALETVHEEKCIRLCGKFHGENIRMTEFIQRVEKDMQRYGARAEEAMLNQGVDFKALSHALRALMQMEELLQTGKIIFPLVDREELISVKLGKYTWTELEPMILSRLEGVDELRDNASFQGVFDSDFAEECVLACYGRTMPSMAVQKNNITCSTRFDEGFIVAALTLERIQEKLSRVEDDYPVKILYACETGSRGWGFASADSDFDVRFVYVHKPDWYLCVAPDEKRDVLELGIEGTNVGELDINGWELRKTLNLFRRSNPALLEWLSSPIVYREKGHFASLLRDAAVKAASPIGLWHHYRSMMEGCITRYWDKKTTIKAWFYIMRPLLAMRWIEMDKGVPPMRFDLLMDGVVDDKGMREELNILVSLKKSGCEQDDFAPPPLIAAYVEREKPRLKENPPHLSPPKGKAELDSIFRAVLTGAWA